MTTYQRDENNVSYMFTSTEQPKEVMRITRDGVWVDPDIQPDEAAKVVLNALDEQIKTLVQRARSDDAAMLRRCLAVMEREAQWHLEDSNEQNAVLLADIATLKEYLK